MKRGNVLVTFLLVFVIVLSSSQVVYAAENQNGIVGFFEDLFDYLFSTDNLQLAPGPTSCDAASGFCVAGSCPVGYYHNSALDATCPVFPRDGVPSGAVIADITGKAIGDICCVPMAAVCGDGSCNGDETCSSCSQDCGDCPSVSDLVLYLPFDGDILDYSGNGFDGSCINCPDQGLGYDGVGLAYEFNGVNDLVTVGDNDNLDLTSDYSILYWAKINNLPPTWNILSKEHYTSDINNAGYVFDGYNNNLYFYPNSDSDAGLNNVNAVINIGGWNHIAVTYNSATSELILYINGSLVASNPLVVSAKEHTNSLYIGSSATPDRFFNGSIDELRIYNRVLSESEIQSFSTILVSGCTIDDDCNYLDNDYCSGTELIHDEGVCNASSECEISTSLTENCYYRTFANLTQHCSLTSGNIETYGDLWGCSAGSCVDTGYTNITTYSVCQDSCNMAQFGGTWILGDTDLCYDESQTYCPQDTFDRFMCIGDLFVNNSCSGVDSINVTTNCNSLDGWQPVIGPTQWVANGECTEKEQSQEAYYDYFCYLNGISSGCDYGAGANETVWVDSGLIRNVSDDTPCSTGICQSGVCVAECVDGDVDGYNITGGNCGPIDCNDENNTINPSIIESCSNGIDDDCDGFSDCLDSDCALNNACLSCSEVPILSCIGQIGRCELCSACNGFQSNGFPNYACVDYGTCGYSCIAGSCGATCNQGDSIEARNCLDSNTYEINNSVCDSSSCVYNVTTIIDFCNYGESCVSGYCISNNMTVMVWDLKQGFNFVSLPLGDFNLVGYDLNYTSNISGDITDAMFAYDADNSRWLVGYGPINTLGDFMPLRGYIYYTNIDMNWIFEGELNNTLIAPLVADQWNLIGVPRNDTINGIYGAGIYTVYEWDGFSYTDVSGSILKNTESYWVYPGVPTLAPPSFSFWNWLTGLFS